ncbi:MAG: phosphotransferase [Candidatus Nanopelagicales bacterium]
MEELRTDDAITARFTPLDLERAAALAIERYGLAPTEVRRFETERDDTFRVAVGADRYVLKVANPADEHDVVAMQCAVLEHLAATDPGLQVPRVVRDVDGSALGTVPGAEGKPRLVRLYTFVPGHVLDYARTTEAQRRGVGALLARLSLALRGFEHPGADRVLAWDLQHLGGLRPQLTDIVDPSARADVAEELDRFDAVTAPGLAAVPHQVVHNDANPDNVVVDDVGDPSGVLDFGDMTRTAVVADLAVAMAYAVGTDEDPWGPAYDVADGYLGVRALSADELALLPHLVRARMAQRMLVNSWLDAANSSNPRHAQRVQGIAVESLRRLVAVPPPIRRTP